MRASASASGLAEALKAAEKEIAADVTGAMKEAADLTKQEWRAAVLSAGLPQRLANTIRSRTYPPKGASLDPAGLVWTKAADIMATMVESVVLRPTGGRRYLAIPTHNVPHKTARTLMTPVEVETTFNQDLIIKPTRNGRLLAFVNVIQAKNAKGWRRATQGRVAQGRTAKLVLMFTLVPFVRTRKRLDLDVIGTKGQAYFVSAFNRITGQGS